MSEVFWKNCGFQPEERMEQDSCLVSKVALWKNIMTFIRMIIIFENDR